MTNELLSEQKATLEQLEAALHELSTQVNKKSLGVAEQSEKKYADLKEKKAIVERDKQKISDVIHELDQRKVEALVTTWKKVNEFVLYTMLC